MPAAPRPVGQQFSSWFPPLVGRTIMQCTRLEKATLVPMQARAGAAALFHKSRFIPSRPRGLSSRWPIAVWRLSIPPQKVPLGGLSMNRIAVAFAGCGVTHLLRPALAADTITAQVIHTGELEGDSISPANAGGMRNKTYVSVDGATISIQDGSPPKHC